MAAAEHAAGSGPTAGEYIIHHLKHLQNGHQSSVVDFSVINLDSVFFTVVLGFVGCFLLWLAASKATSGTPGRFQAAVEMLVEMVDSQAKGIVHTVNTPTKSSFSVMIHPPRQKTISTESSRVED